MYDRRTYLGTNIRDIGNRILDMVIKIRSQTLNKNNYENEHQKLKHQKLMNMFLDT